MDYNKSRMKDNNFVKKDDTKYLVCKDFKGNPVYTDELHKVLLDMMVEIDRVFRKNNIPYAMAFGSALGMYNYKGFIPWDDDVDIAILYEDIDRVIEAFNKDLKDEFTFDCYEVDKGYNVFLPTMKFRKKDSLVREVTELIVPNRAKRGRGLFIDIVAMMELPNDKKEHAKLLNVSKRRIFPMCFFKTLLGIKFNKAQAKLKKFEREVYEKYKGSGTIGKTILVPYQANRKEVHELLYPIDKILPFKEYEFEGHMFYSFNDLEYFLTHFYEPRSLREFKDGEWVDNYPKSKRKSDHYTRINLYSKLKK